MGMAAQEVVQLEVAGIVATTVERVPLKAREELEEAEAIQARY
jgi:hypothetical protein